MAKSTNGFAARFPLAGLFFVIAVALAIPLTVWSLNNVSTQTQQHAASVCVTTPYYGRASQTCGTSYCDNAGVDYASYGIACGSCTYHSWNSNYNCAITGGPWASSCDLTYSQRLSGLSPNGRCIPPPPTGPACKASSNGYYLTWNAVPQVTYKIYDASNSLVATATTNSYSISTTSTATTKTFYLKSYGGGRESTTSTGITCQPPTPTPTQPLQCGSGSLVGGVCVYSNCQSGSSLLPNSAGSCGSINQVCCKMISTPTPTPVPPTCSSLGGTCMINSCSGTNLIPSSSGSCSSPNFVCCVPGPTSTTPTCSSLGGACFYNSCPSGMNIVSSSSPLCNSLYQLCCK